MLVEKPIAVHALDARRMIGAYQAAQTKYPDLVFSAMFMQRTYGHYRKIKDLIDSGELGRLVRTTWIITDWFRTQIYYDSGDWRATWAGEGGGVLLNQCPHNLDLYQWFVGLPARVTGFAHIGKYHDIEVEDEVTAYFEHENGMIGHFVTSTAESPGSNRLEIVGELGKLVDPGYVAVAFPIDELSSVSYGVKPGDHVDVMMTFFFIDIDQETQIEEPLCAPICPAGEHGRAAGDRRRGDPHPGTTVFRHGYPESDRV